MQKQKTLAASFSLKGKGLHTGLDIEITFTRTREPWIQDQTCRYGRPTDD